MMDPVHLQSYEARAADAEHRLDRLADKLSKLATGGVSGGFGSEPPVELLEALRELRVTLGNAKRESDVIKAERDEAMATRDKLQVQNDKLQYRVKHLKRTVEELDKK